MTASSISQRYFEELPRLKAALRLCRTAIESAAIAIDASVVVSGRVKTHRSVLGKAYRRAGKPRDWESLGDLVALKAVFPTSEGVQQFTAWVRDQHRWHPVLDTKESAPNELKYKSMQFDLTCDELTDSRGVPMKVELQVRSAVADAWYVVDHRLRYKGSVALPSDLERKIYRLIVLTELFDEEVQAVIERQAALPEYGVARLYEALTGEIDRLLGGYAKTSRPEGLLELILDAYTPDEVASIEADMAAFVNKQRERLAEVVKDHLHDSANFVEGRDWLHYEPESLLIAERALNRPAMIRAKISGSDFEHLIGPMLGEFIERLR